MICLFRMNLTIEKLPSHDIKCIVTPSENLDNPVNDYKAITFDGMEFEIISHTTISKPNTIPSTLKLLAIGEDMPDERIWKAYPASEKIYFFIVKTK